MINRDSILGRFVYLYLDGSRQMTTGRTLWAIILVKVIVLLTVLLLFFPNTLKTRAEGHEAEYVAGEMLGTETAVTPTDNENP